MSKVKKFPVANIRKIEGGKDPMKLVQEFILRRGYDPDECLQDKTPELMRWMMKIETGEELEVLLEALHIPNETTVYLGVNVATVPIRGANEVILAALEVADGLVGTKLSLVGHYLVLSATLGMHGASVDELDYHFKLIIAQQDWFRTALAEELGWEVEESS